MSKSVPVKSLTDGPNSTTLVFHKYFSAETLQVNAAVTAKNSGYRLDTSFPSRNIWQNTKILSRKVHGINREYFVLQYYMISHKFEHFIELAV